MLQDAARHRRRPQRLPRGYPRASHTHTRTHPSRTVHYHHTTIDTTGHTQHAKQCIFPSPEAHLQGRRGESNRAGALAEVNPFNMEIRPPRHCRREEEKQREAEKERRREKQRSRERQRSREEKEDKLKFSVEDFSTYCQYALGENGTTA